jgi:hypothetical protein
MSEILGKIFGFGDQIKRNIRDFASNPKDYVEGAVHQNNIEWKKDPIERSVGFFNPVPLGTMGNFALRKELGEAVTNLSRREFMKKSAGIAGGTAAASIPGAKLLQKFAPEERALAKEAVVESTPKYKYNSLKEYLDDVQGSVKEKADMAFPHTGKDAWTPREYENALNSDFRRRLLDDEAAYNKNRNLMEQVNASKLPKETVFYDPAAGRSTTFREMEQHVNAFSPQAKQEMKDWKNFTSTYRQADDWSRPDDMMDWINGDRIPF